MTGEEKQKAIDALKISAPIMAVTQLDFYDYVNTINKIMDWLEQETVSRESYEHEYFLRKELEIKIAKLEQQDSVLDKIRKEIEDIAFNSEEIDGEHEGIMILELNDVLNIIDKYKKGVEK